MPSENARYRIIDGLPEARQYEEMRRQLRRILSQLRIDVDDIFIQPGKELKVTLAGQARPGIFQMLQDARPAIAAALGLNLSQIVPFPCNKGMGYQIFIYLNRVDQTPEPTSFPEMIAKFAGKGKFNLIPVLGWGQETYGPIAINLNQPDYAHLAIKGDEASALHLLRCIMSSLIVTGNNALAQYVYTGKGKVSPDEKALSFGVNYLSTLHEVLETVDTLTYDIGEGDPYSVVPNSPVVYLGDLDKIVAQKGELYDLIWDHLDGYCTGIHFIGYSASGRNLTRWPVKFETKPQTQEGVCLVKVSAKAKYLDGLSFHTLPINSRRSNLLQLKAL